MPPHTIIEEIDETLVSYSSEQLFAELLKRGNGNGKEFLASAFTFLKSETKFFDNPEASKVLARLLRDVNGPPASKPVAAAANGSQQAFVKPNPTPTPVPIPTPSAPSVASSSSGLPSSSQQAQTSSSRPAGGAAVPQATDDGEDEKLKGLRPNRGNGADLEKFSWTQSLSEVSLQVPVPKGIRARDCTVDISASRITVGVRGQDAIISGELSKPARADETLWSLDNSVLEITIQKKDRQNWWNSIISGQDVIDTSKVEPESSKLSDLDGETRATVEKMMFDQRQKQMGLPTSEEANKQAMLKKFMAAHPEMDFSNAKIS